MKMKFTKLVCLGIVSFCTVSAMGQEKAFAEGKTERSTFVEEDVRLRADERQMPTSVVEYNEYGNEVGRMNNPTITGPRCRYITQINRWGYSMDHFRSSIVPAGAFDLKYNSNGLLESATTLNDRGDYHNRMQVQYKANGDLISVEYYERPVDSIKWALTVACIYSYDKYDNWVGLHEYLLGKLMSAYTARVDTTGRIVYSIYNVFDEDVTRNGIPFNYFYYIWNYADGGTPNVDAEDNTPVDDSNEGDFDLNVNIPADSISNGSLVVTLPEGFTLDEEDTNLTSDFAANLELEITKQEDNSWRFDIAPKTPRSMSLRAGGAKTLLHVAYKVDKEKQKGTYDILVNSIIFRTKGGNLIPEPAITIPTQVTRDGVSNEYFGKTEPKAYIADNTLYVKTDQNEQIAVYSITGSKLYETTASAGITTINAIGFPKGVLMVKGSSGWAIKVIN